MATEKCKLIVAINVLTCFIGIISFFIGGMIYILFRSETLKMFAWIDAIKLRNDVDCLRNNVTDWHLPEFVIYSLPDGLWMFSYVILIGAQWDYDIRKGSIFIFTVPFIAIGSEILQAFGMLRGTFDALDLLCYILAVLMGLIYITKINKYIYDKK